MPVYFAYGSNLNLPDLQRWCEEKGVEPGFLHAPRAAWLPDWRLEFTHRSVARRGGTLNIARAVGCAVPGVIFDVREGGWAALDRKEGHGYGVHYRRLSSTALLPSGDEVPVETYESARPEAHMRPAAGYEMVVALGYASHDMPSSALAFAAAGTPAPVDRLFVYGSLKRGAWLSHHLTDDLVEVNEASIEGVMLDLGRYPGYRPGPGRVWGELCTVREIDSVLGRLDEVEGFRGFGRPESIFRRVLVEIGGELAWTYRLEAAMDGPEVPGGRWPIDRR